MPNGNILGSKLYQQRAKASLPILVRQAIARQPIYYSDLADEVNVPNPRNLNDVLDCVGQALKDYASKSHRTVPPIQCLVINKQTKLPSRGIAWFIEDVNTFDAKPLKQRRAIVNKQLEDIYDYEYWPEALSAFDIQMLSADHSQVVEQAADEGATSESRKATFGGAGESEAHRKLKEYIASNPHLLGLPSSLKGEKEYALPSGDVLDVFFKHSNDWIAVEVKSHISASTDLIRGIFQCVKYRSVIEAMQASKYQPQSGRAILVLESELPQQLLVLKAVLGVEVLEGIEVR